MSLSPKTEPVLLANIVPGALTALAAVLTAFNWWDPTEEQLGALAGLLAALIAFATAFARGKAWSPASVARVEAIGFAAAAELADQRDQAVAEGARVKAEAAALRTTEVDVVPQPSIGKVTAEALAAIEAMRQGMVKLAPEVAREVVTHLDEQVQATTQRPKEVSVPVPPTVAIHPLVGPVGGRSGPGTEGNV